MTRPILAAMTLAAGLGAAPLAGAQGAAPVPDLRPAPPHPLDTRCDHCHTTDGWADVAFAHERTGFALRGVHARVGCRSCHPQSFTRTLGRECTSCHRDVHVGRLGARCVACHDETAWRTRFDADAHRRGNFPLTGRHAFLPCEECHGDRRDRGFSRSTRPCLDCHQKDYDRTAATALDHRALAFPTACQQCHGAWRFAGAFFPQHEVCFQIGSGKHAGIRCLSCHTSLAGFAVTGQCATGTADCIRCHACAKHPQEPGFSCINRKCYECHRFASSGAGLRMGRPR